MASPMEKLQFSCPECGALIEVVWIPPKDAPPPTVIRDVHCVQCLKTHTFRLSDGARIRNATR